MSNIYDYLRWRGDLSFWQDPFNEVDNLIFSYLSYVWADRILLSETNVMTIEELSKAFYLEYTEEEILKNHSLTKHSATVLKEVAKTNRYRNIRVRNYVNHINLDINLQFSAMEFLLPGDISYLAFRGTDDTIVGWKEDFFLSSKHVEAQEEALAYLNYVGKMSQNKLYLGGHSKGGNLAIYAAACCNEDVKDRIIKIYNNDGPGFRSGFLRSHAYGSVMNRICRILPRESIVGMLLASDIEPIIIGSSARKILQHDPLSWQIEGNHFVYEEDLSRSAKIADQSIKQWIDSIEEEDLPYLINELFSVLEAPGVETLTELYDGGAKTLQIMVKKIAKLSPETKEIVASLITNYVSAWGAQLKLKHRKTDEDIIEKIPEEIE